MALRHLATYPAAALAVATLALSPPASAHGNIQADALTTGDVYYPAWSIGGAYGVAKPLQRQLEQTIRAAEKAGRPVKVALIPQRYDLIDTPTMFLHPQAYSSFLANLLQNTHVYNGLVLVVMPNGVGLAGPQSAPLRAHLGPARPHMSSIWDIDAVTRTATSYARRLGAVPTTSLVNKPSTGARRNARTPSIKPPASIRTTALPVSPSSGHTGAIMRLLQIAAVAAALSLTFLLGRAVLRAKRR